MVERPMSEVPAINDAYMSVKRALVLWTSGSRLRCTAFRNNAPLTTGDIRSHVVDMNTERHLIHQSYTRIENYLLVVSSAFSWSADIEEGEQDISFEAVGFPGVSLFVGDTLFFLIGNGLVGKFTVTSAQSTSWRPESLTRMTITCSQIDNGELLEIYNDASTMSMVFDEKAYARGGGVILLEHTDYRHLVVLRQMRNTLIRTYYARFLDRTSGTLVCPDLPHDPYLTRFVAERVSWSVAKKKPMVLVEDVDRFYRFSIWARMADPTYLSPTKGLWRKWMDVVKTADSNSIAVSGLIGHPYRTITNTTPPDTYVGPDINDGYIFSDKFYNGDRTLITDNLERLVWDAIEMRTTDIAAVLLLLYGFNDLTDAEFYVKGPIYLWLTDTAIRQLETASTPTT